MNGPRRVLEVAAALAQVAPVQRDAPSGPLTTYRVGGPIAALVEVAGLAELLAVSQVLAGYTGPILVIGRGSNLLVADLGFAGIALRLGPAFERIEVDIERGRVIAGGAAALPVVARASAAAGLRGLEFYVGIPGSVGGAVRMNAGGHGADTAGVLVRADVLRLGATQVEERDARALELGFRVSALTDGEVVVQAEFRAAPGDAVAARAEIDEIVRWRREHQPGGQNCGSVFVNPDGDSAGRLIEECGLKGARVGGAVVSEKHANFVQAEPGATAADIVALAELVRARVHERTGRWMRAELRLVGFDGVVLDAPPGPPMRHQNAREDA